MRKEYLSINLNDFVKVKFTDLGYNVLMNDYNGFVSRFKKYTLKTLDDYKREADENGYTSIQFWVFIRRFGHLTGMDNHDLYYDLNILISSDNLKKVL